jgi:uncharacterized repeat protein (TIGR03803 family)
LVRDGVGNLFGTTYAGGDYGSGTVFRLDTTGKEEVSIASAVSQTGDTPTPV